jgi:hypothetical protein
MRKHHMIFFLVRFLIFFPFVTFNLNFALAGFCNVRVSNITMFFLLIIILIIIFFVYIKLKYFTLYGPIPGKSPQFLLGNLLHTGLIYGKYFGHIVQELQVKYGDTFQFWAGPIRMIFVCNPEDVQHVFTHRHIYEQGDLEVDHHRLVFNDALICNIGLYRCKVFLRREYSQVFL